MKGRIGLWLFAFCLCLYALTNAGDFYSSDGEVMYQTAGALTDHGSLILVANPGLPQIVVTVRGEPVGKYDLGMPLALVPFYQIGAWLAERIGADRYPLTRLSVAFFPAVMAALAVWGVCAVVMQFSPARTALTVGLIAAVTTPLWPYSRALFAEPMLAALLIWAVAFALQRRTLIAGVLIGAAVATRAVNVISLPGFLILIAAQGGAWPRRFALCAAGIAPGLLILALHNVWRFGSPFLTGYTGENFTTSPLEGVFGLLFSSGKGVFWYAPPLIMAVWAWPRLRRVNPGVGWALVAWGAAGVIAFGTWAIWHGGWNWGPRYLVPLIPLGVLPLAALPSNRRTQWLLIGLMIAGTALNSAATLANSNDYYAAVGLQTDPAALQRVLFNPPDSPIWAQFGLVAAGQTLSPVVGRLAGYGLPPALTALIPVLLCFGLILTLIRLGWVYLVRVLSAKIGDRQQWLT